MPEAATNPELCVGGMVLAGGGSTKVEFLAFRALE
jgi:hypothetical protein